MLDHLTSLGLMAAMLTFGMPAWEGWRSSSRLGVARAQFEADWHWARWWAKSRGQTLRLQSLRPCAQAVSSNHLNCGWQWVSPAQNQVVRETALTPGLSIAVKPADGWQVDAWGDPLGGGASVGFQIGARPLLGAETLCLNVVGRLRRVKGDACSD